MLSKVICFFVLIAVAYSAPQHLPAERYPAGVNPAACPGYPICDNSLLHGTPPVAPAAYSAPSWNTGAHSWNVVNAAPQWNEWNHQPAAYAYDHSGDIQGPGGDKYPAGVSPAACPNYPYCDTNLGSASHVAPLPGYTQRLYPAGVSPAACPNFPYCHNN